MTTNLPVQIDLARNDDLRIAFVFRDNLGEPIDIPAGVFSFILRWRGISKTIPLVPREGETNILDGVALLASLSDMPIGQPFIGDLALFAGGASNTWASLAVQRMEVAQTTEDLGARTVIVTRSEGVTVSIDLDDGAAITAAQRAAALAEAWAAQPVGEDVEGAAPGSRSALDRAAAAAGFASQAQGYRDTTAGYRDAAEGFKNTASDASGEAIGARDTTLGYRNEAEGFRDTAQTKADEAATSAINSANSANASQGFRDTAEGYLNSVSALALTVAANATAAQQASANATAISQSSLAGFIGTILMDASVTALAFYDTARDDDWGAWRDKVSHLSWFASFGRYPSKSLIVYRTASVTIFNLDDVARPVWATFPVQNGAIYAGGNSIAAKNGVIGIGATSNGFTVLDLISNSVRMMWQSGTLTMLGGIAEISSVPGYGPVQSPGIASSTVNSVAMFTLLQTPRNPARCDLPNPTIALGTAGGASIIRWDGVVCNSSNTAAVQNVSFMADGTLAARSNANTHFIPPAVYQTPSWAGIAVTSNAIGQTVTAYPLRYSQVPAASSSSMIVAGRRVVAGHSAGGGMFSILPDLANLAASLADYKTNLFSTGLMGQNCQLALAESMADLSSLIDTPVVTEEFDYADQAAMVAAGWSAPSGGGTIAFPVAGSARFTSGAANDTSSRQFSGFVVGKAYEIIVDAIINGGATGSFFVGTTLGGAQTLNPASFATGLNRVQFIAAATNHWFSIRSNVTGNWVEFASLIIREVAMDRRGLGNTNGGFVSVRPVGTVTRTAAATGSELALYGGFSNVNYLEGAPVTVTDEMNIAFVADLQNAGSRQLFSNQDEADSSRRGVILTNGIGSSQLQLGVRDATGNVSSLNVTHPGNGLHLIEINFSKSRNRLDLWVDGTLRGTTNVSTIVVPFTTGPQLIGKASAASTDRIGQFRLATAFYTPDQIRARYEYERQWFNPNAKCLLAGSASINSLAYDADADEIIAATPVGTNLIDAKTGMRIGYVQSTTAANRINAEATVTGSQATVARENTGGPANWGVDRYRWSLTENSATNQHRADFPTSLLTAASWVYAAPVFAGSRTWVRLTANGGAFPQAYFNTATGAGGTTAGGATVFPSVNLGGGWWLVQFTFTGTAANYQPQFNSASADNVVSFAGDNGASGPALYFGKPVLMQRSTPLTAADYQYALSNSDNHTIVAGNDNMLAIRTANGVDLWLPAIGQRERATARRGVAPYDPTRGRHEFFTTDATPTRMFVMSVPEGTARLVKLLVHVAQHGGVISDRASYEVVASIRRDIGGNATLVLGTPTVLDETTVAMDLSVATGLPADLVGVSFAGKAATRLAGVAVTEIIEAPLGRAA
jgi:hypothetical protein